MLQYQVREQAQIVRPSFLSLFDQLKSNEAQVNIVLPIMVSKSILPCNTFSA